MSGALEKGQVGGPLRSILSVSLVVASLFCCGHLALPQRTDQPRDGVMLAGAVDASNVNVAEQYLELAADRERGELGLPALRWDRALAQAARAHVRLMVEHNGISHQFPEELDVAGRGAAAGARFSLISENVAESPSAVKIHAAWMKSEGHRRNLLDANVDAVGIAVMARGTQLFAVEDFERTVAPVALEEQEKRVAEMVARSGVTTSTGGENARQTCADEGSVREEGLGHRRQADFVMRYTTANLDRVPDQLQQRLKTGKYRNAVVGACREAEGEEFTMYRLAVLLYRAGTLSRAD